MPQRPLRTLSEQEYTAIQQRLLNEAPDGLDEAGFHRWIGSRLAAAIGEAEASPAPVEGSALGRFASNAWDMVNPVSLVKGAANAVMHPIDTVTGIAASHADQFGKARQALNEGRYSEALGHGASSVVPVVGPILGEIGEQAGEGDLAGAAGSTVGLLAGAKAPGALRAAKKALPSGVRASTAAALEEGAASRYANVMRPEVGPNARRFGGMAERVAPELASNPEMSAFSREGLHGKVQQGLASAEQALDAAADARLSARTVKTQPIIEALLEKRRALTSEAVEGSRVSAAAGPPTTRTTMGVPGGGTPTTTTITPKGSAIGTDVVPGPNAARVAEIDRAIAELKQLGPVTRYDPLRVMRQAYDGPAKAVYNPSLTADFMKAQGGKLGAADVTGALRDTLAKIDPATAQANAAYSLYLTADDVLQATAEVERTRTKVGRRIMSRLTGTVAGGQVAGAQGAIGGMVFGPALDYAFNAGWTTQLKTAQLMTKLAKAIRAGDEGYVASLSSQLKRLGAQSTALQATSPSGSQGQTTAPARP